MILISSVNRVTVFHTGRNWTHSALWCEHAYITYYACPAQHGSVIYHTGFQQSHTEHDSQPRFLFLVLCLTAALHRQWICQTTAQLSCKKLEVLICPWELTLSEDSHAASCKYKWIIRSLSDAVEWRVHSLYLLLMPDVESSEFPNGFFECCVLWGILILVPSTPLLQVDSQGPGGLRGLSHAVDTRHQSLFLGCYHGNPRRKCRLWTILSYIYLHCWHLFISLCRLLIEKVTPLRIWE